MGSHNFSHVFTRYYTLADLRIFWTVRKFEDTLKDGNEGRDEIMKESSVRIKLLSYKWWE